MQRAIRTGTTQAEFHAPLDAADYKLVRIVFLGQRFASVTGQRIKLKYLILRYLNTRSPKCSLASAGRSDGQLRQQVFYVDEVVVKNLLGDIQQLEDFG